MSKVFISYKYRDTQVKQILGLTVPEFRGTTPRNYVDILDNLLTQSGHICKAEESNEDLSGLSEDTITAKLADRIYDSTVTIVLISKGMRETDKPEKEQWIPWEISYSLRENTRGGRTSATNAMIAIVLPDEYGSYSYMITDHNCISCQGRTWHTGGLFRILKRNMFNRTQRKSYNCNNPFCGLTNIHIGNDHSYIHPLTWVDFKGNINLYIKLALERQENMDEYDIEKELT